MDESQGVAVTTAILVKLPHILLLELGSERFKKIPAIESLLSASLNHKVGGGSGLVSSWREEEYCLTLLAGIRKCLLAVCSVADKE